MPASVPVPHFPQSYELSLVTSQLRPATSTSHQTSSNSADIVTSHSDRTNKHHRSFHRPPIIEPASVIFAGVSFRFKIPTTLS